MKKKLLKIVVITLVCISVLSMPTTAKFDQTQPTSVSTIDVSCDDYKMNVYPNENAVFMITITNIGNMADGYVIDCPDIIDGYYWHSLTTNRMILSPGESDVVVLTVTPYLNTEIEHIITVRATSMSNPRISDSIQTHTQVINDARIIDAATDKAVYDKGENVMMSITNVGPLSINGNPGFYIFDRNQVLIGIVCPDVIITLESGESFTIGWSTDYKDVLEGRYIIEGRFVTYGKTFVDDASIAILTEEVIEVFTNKLVYSEGDKVQMSLINLAYIPLEGSISFNIYNEEDELVGFCYPDTWFVLWPGQYYVGWWIADDMPEGKYVVKGKIADYTDIHISCATFFIKEGKTIDVTTDIPIYEGMEKTLLMTITNIQNKTLKGSIDINVYNYRNELVAGCHPKCIITLKHGDHFTVDWKGFLPQ